MMLQCVRRHLPRATRCRLAGGEGLPLPRLCSSDSAEIWRAADSAAFMLRVPCPASGIAAFFFSCPHFLRLRRLLLSSPLLFLPILLFYAERYTQILRKEAARFLLPLSLIRARH